MVYSGCLSIGTSGWIRVFKSFLIFRIKVLQLFMALQRLWHNDAIPIMAQDVTENKESFGVAPVTIQNVQCFLSWFYMGCIATRMLLTQHSSQSGGKGSASHQKHSGSINPKYDVAGAVKDGYGNARRLCDLYHTNSPELELELMQNHQDNQDKRMICLSISVSWCLNFSRAHESNYGTPSRQRCWPPCSSSFNIG